MIISHPIDKTMERIFISVTTLYTLFVIIYFLYLRAGKKRRKNIVGKGGIIPNAGQLKQNIVGKSRFDLRALTSVATKLTPQTDVLENRENTREKPDIFAPPNGMKSSAEVPSGELDDLFSDTYPPEENQPMDIDYPLEYETSAENDEEPEEEDEEVAGTAQAVLASGVSFEDLGNVVRTIVKTEKAGSEQRRKAGDTLLEIRKTDMFEQMVSGKPDAKKIVTELMAESLADFHRRKDQATAGSGRKAPDSFNVRDFA